MQPYSPKNKARPSVTIASVGFRGQCVDERGCRFSRLLSLQVTNHGPPLSLRQGKMGILAGRIAGRTDSGACKYRQRYSLGSANLPDSDREGSHAGFQHFLRYGSSNTQGSAAAAPQQRASETGSTHSSKILVNAPSHRATSLWPYDDTMPSSPPGSIESVGPSTNIAPRLLPYRAL